MLDVVSHNAFVVLFGAIALGLLIGAIRVGGVSLGAAGVFFVALVFGHFGRVVPHELMEFGLLMFVYAVGLQSGPQFFGMLRSRGLAFLAAGVGSTLAAAAAALLLGWLLKLPAHLAAGLYCGATTCTPALAATLDVVGAHGPDLRSAAAVGYGAAYPFSIAGAVVIVQLLPRLTRLDPKRAAQEFEQEQAARTPPLETLVFQITNPNIGGLTVREFNDLRLFDGVISRIRRGENIVNARPDFVLHLGDLVRAVARPEELEKLETVVGNLVAVPMDDPSGAVATELVIVSRREAIGRTIRELGIRERFGVAVTRVRRNEFEFTPRPDFVLQTGDALRVVGSPEEIRGLTDLIGRESRRLGETSLVPFALGIVLGIAVGMIPIPLPGDMTVRLGLGGGAFIVALLVGRYSAVSRFPIHVPAAVINFARDLGLVAFLAGAGTAAGKTFVPVVQQTGPMLFIAGALVTLTALLSAGLILFVWLRWNLLSAAGAMCACMTNPPGLAAANQLAPSEAPAAGFASVYPVALLAKIVFAPTLYLLLSRIASSE